MTRRPSDRAALFLALSLAACVPAPDGPAPTDLAAALVPRTGTAPPAAPAGACWAADVTPAVVETVTEQVMTEPERRAADGSLIAPARFRSESRQRIVSDRRDVWFRTLCPDEVTADLVTTLQRALKARGLFPGPLTGRMDAGTAAAVRAWQRPRGLDSATLARASALALGVVAVGRG